MELDYGAGTTTATGAAGTGAATGATNGGKHPAKQLMPMIPRIRAILWMVIFDPRLLDVTISDVKNMKPMSMKCYGGLKAVRPTEM